MASHSSGPLSEESIKGIKWRKSLKIRASYPSFKNINKKIFCRNLQTRIVEVSHDNLPSSTIAEIDYSPVGRRVDRDPLRHCTELRS